MKQVLQILFLGLFVFVFSNCAKDDLNQDFSDLNQMETEATQSHTHGGRKCSSHDFLKARLAKHPEAAKRRQALEEHTRNFIANADNTASSRSVITIPVVVHVLWKTAAQNVSEAQINSQLDVLNEDFRRLNSDVANTPSAFLGVAADAEIEFCLATQDPNGNATTGITRRQTTKASFNPDTEDIKHQNKGGQDSWNTDDYLNIWVGNISQDVLGWATFPDDNAGDEDGVVITYKGFGTTGSAEAPFNLGRTGTHEVGHWLNLYHIWGDGGCGVDDEVSDTPASDAANYGCTPSHTSCGSTDMPQNYMDYSDDACMNLFTNGQKARMQALFTAGGPRVSLLSSAGCNGTGGGGGGNNDPCDKPTDLTVSNVTGTTATVTWTASNDASYYRLRYRAEGETTWTLQNNITATTHTLTGLTEGTSYDVRAQAKCGNSFTTNTGPAVFTTQTGSGGGGEDCVKPTDVNAGNLSSTTATVTWTGSNGASYYKLRYRANGTTSWMSQSNISATTYQITGLTAGTTYTVRVQARCGDAFTPTSFDTFTTQTGGTSGGDGGCSNNYEPNNTVGTAVSTTADANGDKSSMIATSGDIDWFEFSNTSAKRNIVVTLRSLPADYDVYLYKDGQIVDYSYKEGLKNELITFNTNVVGTYQVKIEGYDGASDNSDCYDLRVRTRANPFQSSELADKSNSLKVLSVD